MSAVKDTGERLAVVETRLEGIEQRMDAMDEKLDRRMDQLIEIINRPKLLEQMLVGTGAFIKDNTPALLKIVIYIALGAGGAGAVQAIWP